MENLRSIPVSDLLTGHDSASVLTQFNAALPAAVPWLASMTQAIDPTVPAPAAGSGATAKVSTSPVLQTINNVVYGVTTYLGTCILPAPSPGTLIDCGTAAAPNGTSYLRAVVAVTWRDSSCHDISQCAPSSYFTATLLSTGSDPTFNLKQGPPALPVVANPGNQVSTLGDSEALQLGTQPNTAVPPLTWAVTAGALPAGLALGTAGLISGSATTVSAATSITVTVTDGFGRTASATFTWAVVAAPTITALSDQSTAVNVIVSVATRFSCPNSPCTFSLVTAPVGLAISSVGLITGAPTVAGTVITVLAIKDNDGVSATSAPFNWAVSAPVGICTPAPSLANGGFEAPGVLPGAGWPVPGGSAALVWNSSASDHVVEFWANGGSVQGSNGGTAITAQEGSQWVELNANYVGSLFQDVVTTPGQILQWSVWHRARTVVSGDTTGQDVMQVQIGSITTQTAQVPTGQTTAAISDGPTAWVNHVGVYTVPAGQTITRLQFAAISTSSGSPTVGNFIDNVGLTNAPCLSAAVGAQTTIVNTTISPLQLTAAQGSGTYSWSATGLPVGLSITAAGLITGTPTVVGSNAVTVTLTDGQTLLQQTLSFTWTVAPKPIVPPTIVTPANRTTTIGASFGVTLTSTCANAPCTFSMTGAPAGLTINAATGVISGPPTAVGTSSSVRVTIRDSTGLTATTAAFSWTVKAAPTIAPPGTKTATSGQTFPTTALNPSCPNAPCTYAVNNGPSALSIDSNGILSGTITSGPQVFANVRLSATDSAGVTTFSARFTFTVNAVTPNGHWNFDESSVTAANDSGTGNHDATAASANRTQTAAQGARALTTTGSSPSAAVTSGGVLTTTGSYTVSAWIKFNNVIGYQTVVSQDGANVSAFYLGLDGSTQGFRFFRLAADSTSIGSPDYPKSRSKAVAGQWYQLTGVYDQVAGTESLYVDGVLQSTTAAPAGWSSSGRFAIGRGLFLGGGTDWVNGSIDDVRAYNVALNADSVAQLAQAGYWNLDEGSGTVANDGSPYPHDGALAGAATWTAGVVGPYAVGFNGTTNYINPNTQVLDTMQSYSVTAWARPDLTTDTGTVASQDGPSRTSGFWLEQINNKWAFVAAGSDVRNPALTQALSTLNLVTGSWYQLTGVYDGDLHTLTLYVNGVLQSTVPYTASWEATGSFEIGRGKTNGANADFFVGAVDDVHAYQFLLDQAGVTALAASPPPTPVAPSAVAGAGSATVSWVAPSPIAGQPVTGYVVTPYLYGQPQTPVSFGTAATTQAIGGLTAGAPYTFTVAAVNANGSSADSAVSAPVVPT